MSKNNRNQKPTSRAQQDRYLERNGLLNYQTQGVSQAEVAQRYANARIQVDTGSKWYQENYKGNPAGQPAQSQQQIAERPNPTSQPSQQDPMKMLPPEQRWNAEYQKRLTDTLGYLPTSGQDPKWIADAYNKIKAAPNDAALPEYLRTQKDQISEAYNWFSFRNGNKPYTEWSYLNAEDPAHDFLKTIQPAPQATTPAGYGGATLDQVKSGAANWTDITVADRRAALSDPKFYSQNKILSYPQAIQQQMYSDPAFDWDKLPKLQRVWFELSSRPAAMGAINAGGVGLIGGAIVGGIPGALIGGAVAGVSGAVLGKAAGWAGYDQNKEMTQQGDGKFDISIQQVKDTINFAMGALNYLAEKGEQTIGTAAQVAHAAIDPNTQVKDVLNKDTFNSSMAFYETITPSIVGNVIGAAVGEDGKLTMKDALNFLPWVYSQNVITGLIAEPEKYKGQEIYIGAALPVQLQQDWTERLAIAREQVAAGRNYREVTTEMQTGIMAQVGDLIGQTIFDPLNLLPHAETQVGKIGSAISGNKIAAEAFRGTVGFEQAKVKYSNIVTTFTEAVKIDPTFDVSKLSWVEKHFAGLNNQGEIKAGSVGFTQKGLLDPISKAEANPSPFKINLSGKSLGEILIDPINFWKNVVNETAISRAQTGLTMFDRNIGNIISMFKDPTEAAGYLERIARGDNTAWAEMGSQIGNSPEWYTIQPALKDYVATKLRGLAEAYVLTKDNRSALNRMAEVLRQDPTKLIDEWASRNTRDQDFTRVIQAAKEDGSPAAKALLEDYKSGHFTPDTLRQIVEAFHGEGALPYTDAQWKWAMYADLSDHFSGWVADHLQLDQSPEAKNAFFRMAGVLKQAQSILLLGASPGYAIQNGLSGIVHLAVTGIYGNQTPGQMRDWITRWETPIPRLDEGVGIGGLVDTAKSTAISDATKGTGPLTDIKRTLGKLSRGMPMSKLSSKFESINSKRGYVTAIQQFMGKSWRRGVGFSKMDPALIKVLQDAGINPDHIYSAFEAGVNQRDIENALIAPYAGQKVEAMIHDAATAAGIKPADAAEMLDIIGVTDTLNTFLKGADTPDKVDVAFARANRKMQDWIDIKAGENLKIRAEEVKNIVSREGMAAGLKISQQASDQFFAAWFDHYDRFGDVMGGLEGLDPAMRSKAIEEAYRQSDVNFRRVFAQMGANYKGIFDAWSLSGDPSALGSLRAISDMNNSMKKAYDFMRQANRDLTATLIREDRAPTWKELGAKNKSVNAVFKQAFIEKHQAEVAMGVNLKGVYTKLHGELAGKAAQLWWNDVTKFSEKIVADETRFRAEIDQKRAMGASQADIADAKKKYYSENKLRFISDLQNINDEGIARLERIIKNGGQQTPTPTPTPPTQPTPGTEAPTAEAKPAKPTKEKKLTKAQEHAAQMEADTIALLATNKIDAEEASARKAQQDIVWAIARNYKYDNLKIGGDYDAHALTRSLRNETYGGYPGAELYDVRFTPEKVIEILEKRKTLKQTEADKKTPPSIQKIKKASKNNQDDINILSAIRGHGGLNIEKIAEYAGDKKVGNMFGVFQKNRWDTGWDISDMARVLADDHYAIDLNDPNDLGGVNQTQELLRRALAGEKIYPINHDYLQDTAKIDAMELAHIEALKADEAAFAVEKFNQDTWHSAMKDAIANKDGDAVESLFADLPDNLADTPHDMDGETYAEYVLRAQDAIDADAVNDAQASAIAQAKTQTDQHMADAETRAEAATTRTMILEQITEIWGGDQAQRWIEIEDAKIRGLAKVMGEDFDSVYARYYAEFRKSLEMDPIEALKEEWLKQYSPIEGGAERAKTPEDIQNFARMLARKSESDVGAAIREEALLSDRVAILDALYNMNPTLAENVARNEWSALMQNAEGASQVEPADVHQHNMTEGKAKLQEAIDNKADIEKVFYRPEVGYIDLMWGFAGTKGKAFKDGSGLSHIIARRDLEGKNGTQFAKDVYKIIANGTFREKYARGNSIRINVEYEGLESVIGLDYHGETKTWLFTSFEKYKKSPDAAEGGKAPQGATQSSPSDISTGLVAGDDLTIAQGWVKINKTIGAKGAVTFDAAGIKATIHAFEAADVTTLIHESGHVFLKMMNDAAERTGNAQLKRDLLTIADHTRADEVSPGKWKAANAIDTITEANGKYIYQGVGGPQEFPTLERARFVLEHEVFARTYENYVATGTAPTPHLKAAFDSFRKWMLEVYKTITGSEIDIKITPEVKDVFDRMLGAEKADVDAEAMAEYKDYYDNVKITFDEARRGYWKVRYKNDEWTSSVPTNITGFDNIVKFAYAQDRRAAALFSSGNKSKKSQDGALYQRNKAQVSSNQFDMFAPRPAEQPAPQADGTTGGMLPGMQDATGMMFDVQEGGGIRKMDTGSARSIYDIDPTKTAGEYKAGDIVQDADGKQHTVAGANMRSKIITEKGRILEPKDVTRVAKQGDLFSLPPEPKPTEAIKNYIKPTKANLSKIFKWSSSRYNETSKARAIDITLSILAGNEWRPMWKEHVSPGDITRPMTSLGGKERVEVKITKETFTAGGYTDSSTMGGYDYVVDGVEGTVSRDAEVWYFKEPETDTLDSIISEAKKNKKYGYFDGWKQGTLDAWKEAVNEIEKITRNRTSRNVLANALAVEFKDLSATSLIGKKITSTEDLAVLVQVYRNPKFETLRYIFVKGNEVVGQVGVSSRMPGASQIFPNMNDIEGINYIRSLKGNFGADGYYLQHNHPSGISRLSAEDIGVTEYISNNVEGFRGHVVIDHKEWSIILPDGTKEERMPISVEFQYDENSTPTKAHPLLGTEIHSSQDLMRMAKDIQQAEGWAVIVTTHVSTNKVVGIMEVDPGSITSPIKGEAMIRKFARDTGGGAVFLVVPEEMRAYAKEAIQKELIWDVVIGNDSFGLRRSQPNIKTYNARKVNEPQALWQSADLPLGTFPEEAPHAQAMAEGMNDHILPLMKALQDVARKNLGNKPLDGAMKDLSPEGRAMLNKYTRQVQADLAGTKNAATKWGESRRDFAMLNYNKRYGFDRYLEAVYPYQFFYTRSLATWAARALDKPAMFATYARIKKQQNRYERDIPERLRGKIKINMPWLPDWMGDALYIDPLKTLFTPLNYLRPLERMMQDASYQQIEAERILQEWAADGSVNESEIVNAIKTRDGATWERAYAEAQIRRESEINNPVDFMNSMLGPAWYLTTPWKLLKGQQAGIGSTPILNTTRAIETVAKGTWAQPMGDLIGMLGKPEEMLRKKLGIPEFGEYGDYYVDRQLANMVADGKTTSQLATQAMIERTGPLFDEARQRVKMELAMRVPTASMFMAGLTGANFAQGVAQMAMASPASLFGAGLLPAGELEYRGLKQEWNEAWKMKDAGDPKAITAFFDAHPEYESFLAKGKPPEERLKSFLIGQIWDGYMGLGKTDQKTVGAAMGNTFRQSFLDKETRSYDALDVTTLTHWAQMLSMMTPKTEATLPAIEQPAAPINFYPEEVSAITDKFFTDRTAKFPNYYVMEQGFYSLAKSDRARYLIQFPKLRQYWDWKDTYMKTYPELAPIMKGQVFKTLDTSAWPPMLEDAVMNYAYSGSKMGKGTYAALQQVWIQEGQPLGDMMSWVNSTVVPAMLYQAQPQP